MASMDEQILRATKEIVVKFIEGGRISPASFPDRDSAKRPCEGGVVSARARFPLLPIRRDARPSMD